MNDAPAFTNPVRNNPALDTLGAVRSPTHQMHQRLPHHTDDRRTDTDD